jgi:hypothetical protein
MFLQISVYLHQNTRHYVPENITSRNFSIILFLIINGSPCCRKTTPHPADGQIPSEVNFYWAFSPWFGHCETARLDTTGLHDWTLWDGKFGHCETARLGTVGLHDWALWDGKIGHCGMARLGTVGWQDWALCDGKIGHCATARLGTVGWQD